MKNTIYLSLLFAALFTFMFCEYTNAQTYTADYYNVRSGTGKGLSLWNGSNNYKIHMGNTAEYHYGPVTNYSIKTNMYNNAARGWTWGAPGLTPTAALTTRGNFQIAGWMKNMSRYYYFGDAQRLYGDNSSALYWRGAHSTVTQLILQDKEGTRYGRLYGSGNGALFGLLDGDGNWSYLASKDSYTAFRINNSEKMRINANGSVGIGTAPVPPGYKLAVLGNIIAERVRVQLVQNWPDYVFQEDYDLMTIEELNENIKQNGHLPNIPDAATMTAEGQDLGEMQVKMMEKIEELTLYIIELNKRIKTLEAENTELKTEK